MAHRTKDCWTERLWNLAHADPKCERTREGGILVQGPYGAAARHFSEYEKVVGIGAGFGVVPMMSLMKHHYLELFAMDRAHHERRLAALANKCRELYYATDRAHVTLWRMFSRCLPSFTRNPRGEEELEKSWTADELTEGAKRHLRRVLSYTGPHTTTAFARRTPFLEDFSRPA